MYSKDDKTYLIIDRRPRRTNNTGGMALCGGKKPVKSASKRLSLPKKVVRDLVNRDILELYELTPVELPQ